MGVYVCMCVWFSETRFLIGPNRFLTNSQSLGGSSGRPKMAMSDLVSSHFWAWVAPGRFSHMQACIQHGLRPQKNKKSGVCICAYSCSVRFRIFCKVKMAAYVLPLCWTSGGLQSHFKALHYPFIAVFGSCLRQFLQFQDFLKHGLRP